MSASDWRPYLKSSVQTVEQALSGTKESLTSLDATEERETYTPYVESYLKTLRDYKDRHAYLFVRPSRDLTFLDASPHWTFDEAKAKRLLDLANETKGKSQSTNYYTILEGAYAVISALPGNPVSHPIERPPPPRKSR
jgi:hypothetical protein